MSTETDEQNRVGGAYYETWISVDVECSGQCPGDNSLLSIGAVVVGDHTKTFYIELKPLPGAKVDAKAMEVNGLDLSQLELSGAEPAEAMDRFGKWAKSLGGRPVFCSFGSYDWLFCAWYFHHFLGRNPFGPNSLEVKSFYLGVSGKRNWNDAIKKKIPADLQWGRGHSHRADDDALEQAVLLENVILRRRAISYALRTAPSLDDFDKHPNQQAVNECPRPMKARNDAGIVASNQSTAPGVNGAQPTPSVTTPDGTGGPGHEGVDICRHGKAGPHTWTQTSDDDEYACLGPGSK